MNADIFVRYIFNLCYAIEGEIIPKGRHYTDSDFYTGINAPYKTRQTRGILASI